MLTPENGFTLLQGTVSLQKKKNYYRYAHPTECSQPQNAMTKNALPDILENIDVVINTVTKQIACINIQMMIPVT